MRATHGQREEGWIHQGSCRAMGQEWGLPPPPAQWSRIRPVIHSSALPLTLCCLGCSASRGLFLHSCALEPPDCPLLLRYSICGYFPFLSPPASSPECPRVRVTCSHGSIPSSLWPRPVSALSPGPGGSRARASASEGQAPGLHACLSLCSMVPVHWLPAPFQGCCHQPPTLLPGQL